MPGGLQYFQNQRYHRLLVAQRKLASSYVDPAFPPAPQSLFQQSSSLPAMGADVVWKRPNELVENPKLVTSSTFDARRVVQGAVGNCWLLSSLGVLATHPELLDKVIPSWKKQCWSHKSGKPHPGIFRFRFYRFGAWVEVVVDDYLPTIDGKLIFAHSSNENEFWMALLEKAYAKLNGSYQSLELGSSDDAIVDLTDTVSEHVDLRDPGTWTVRHPSEAQRRHYTVEEERETLIKVLYMAIKHGALMCCSLDAEGTDFAREQRLDNGLIVGHAYGIHDIRRVQRTSLPRNLFAQVRCGICNSMRHNGRCLCNENFDYPPVPSGGFSDTDGLLQPHMAHMAMAQQVSQMPQSFNDPRFGDFAPPPLPPVHLKNPKLISPVQAPSPQRTPSTAPQPQSQPPPPQPQASGWFSSVRNFFNSHKPRSMQSKKLTKNVYLIKLRNPWGSRDEQEWSGAWSTSSIEWSMLGSKAREVARVTEPGPGEFWMSFEDLVDNFTSLFICRKFNTHWGLFQRRWHDQAVFSSWSLQPPHYSQKALGKSNHIRAIPHTCGGSVNFASFPLNNQFMLDLTKESVVAVSLMQRDTRNELFRAAAAAASASPLAGGNTSSQPTYHVPALQQQQLQTGELLHEMVPAVQELDPAVMNRYTISIGFVVFKVELNRQYRIHRPYEAVGTVTYVNARQVFSRFILPAGRYVLIPNTYLPGSENDFFLRVFTSEPSQFKLLKRDLPKVPRLLRCFIPPFKGVLRITILRVEGLPERPSYMLGKVRPKVVVMCSEDESLLFRNRYRKRDKHRTPTGIRLTRAPPSGLSLVNFKPKRAPAPSTETTPLQQPQQPLTRPAVPSFSRPTQMQMDYAHLSPLPALPPSPVTPTSSASPSAGGGAVYGINQSLIFYLRNAHRAHLTLQLWDSSYFGEHFVGATILPLDMLLFRPHQSQRSVVGALALLPPTEVTLSLAPIHFPRSEADLRAAIPQVSGVQQQQQQQQQRLGRVRVLVEYNTGLRDC
ncbi:calcium-dependent cysteine-type endopeptidase-like protein [Sorochytrium milnesiophthora]